MTAITSYLTFNGKCREAMNFYKNCLGGELVFQTVGESPVCNEMPEQMRDSILHSTLIKGPVVLMGSDMAPKALVAGNTVSLMLNCSSEEEAKEVYPKLAAGGTPHDPLQISFWGALFGSLTDKYGNQWLVHYDKNYKQSA